MTKSKTIINVLLCSKDNNLRLANVILNIQIMDIQYLLLIEINWNEVSYKESWCKFVSIQNQNKNDNYIIDGKYLLLISGAIDAHVHFITPGFEEREDSEHGSLAAAFGGVNTVINIPCTSIPPVKLNLIVYHLGKLYRMIFLNSLQLIMQVVILKKKMIFCKSMGVFRVLSIVYHF